MKVYKGTDKNMVCNPGGNNPFQFEIGVTYEKPKAELCRHGFHACEAPLDVFGYYPPGKGSRYFEAELEDVSPERESDSKVCGKKITLGAEIGIPGLVKAHFEYVKSKCEEEQSGGNGSALKGGDWSALNGGNWSALKGGDGSALNGGNWSALKGGDGSALKGGDCSALKGGNWSALKGGYGSALNGGNWSALKGGYGSALKGGDGSVMRGGACSKFKGGMWAVFAAEIRDNNCKLIGMKVGVVDGETLKPDVWYTLKDGEFVEAEEGE